MVRKYKPSETTLLSDLSHRILALGKQKRQENYFKSALNYHLSKIDKYRHRDIVG